MIELELIGAAQTVTGSKHLLRTSRANVLLDCGLFQGRRAEAFEKNRNFPIDVQALDAVVLSHAHIDHSGALPLRCDPSDKGSVRANVARYSDAPGVGRASHCPSYRARCAGPQTGRAHGVSLMW